MDNDAYEQGYEAWHCGCYKSENPYSEGGEKWMSWRLGWMDADYDSMVDYDDYEDYSYGGTED